VTKYFTGDGHPSRQVNLYHNTKYNPYKSTNANVTLTVTSEGAALKHKDQESGRRHPRKSGIRKEGREKKSCIRKENLRNNQKESVFVSGGGGYEDQESEALKLNLKHSLSAIPSLC
jgi:hypothetical protein